MLVILVVEVVVLVIVVMVVLVILVILVVVVVVLVVVVVVVVAVVAAVAEAAVAVLLVAAKTQLINDVVKPGKTTKWEIDEGHPTVQTLTAHYRSVLGKTKQKSYPRAIIVGKCGSETAFLQALRDGDIVEITDQGQTQYMYRQLEALRDGDTVEITDQGQTQYMYRQLEGSKPEVRLTAASAWCWCPRHGEHMCRKWVQSQWALVQHLRSKHGLSEEASKVEAEAAWVKKLEELQQMERSRSPRSPQDLRRPASPKGLPPQERALRSQSVEVLSPAPARAAAAPVAAQATAKAAGPALELLSSMFHVADRILSREQL
eukprot:s5665_g11.t1